MTSHWKAFPASALATLAFLTAAAPAHAADATLAEVRELASRAAGDPSALDELRRIDSVDGRPVDLEAALSGDRSELDERLETLAAGGRPADVEAAAARGEAADILDERRFREPDAPRPFRRPLAWLGDRLEELYDALAERLPGGSRTLWTILAALVVAGAALGSLRLVRRRAGRSVEGAAGRRGGRRADPAELERKADESERRGDLEAALRLRFRAGLLRLERASAIPFRQSLTSGEISRRLHSANFDRLAGTFDEIVYGGRAPEPRDVDSSREGWARVLEEVSAR